jgi:hypothetical protein
VSLTVKIGENRKNLCKNRVKNERDANTLGGQKGPTPGENQKRAKILFSAFTTHEFMFIFSGTQLFRIGAHESHCHHYRQTCLDIVRIVATYYSTTIQAEIW